jgi:uncharacterized membrane protein YfcA
MELISQNVWLLVATFGAISIGALLKGMTGLGLPLFAVPVLAALSSVEEAVILMIIPGIAANLWIALHRHRYSVLLKQHWPFLVSGFFGGIAGTLLLRLASDRTLKLLLIIWLGSYLLQHFMGKKPLRVFTGPARFGYVTGLLAGTTQGATGISAHVVAPYYHSRALEAPAYAFLITFTFLLFSVAQMAGALGTDLLTPERLQISLVALVPTLVFTRIGIQLADRISQVTFNRLLLIVFCLLEIKLLADVI